MSFVAKTSVQFCGTSAQVYDLLCQLGRYPEWNQDMFYISVSGRMKEGLKYITKSHVAGRVNEAEVEVERLIPNKEILLKNNSGIIAFDASIRLETIENSGTKVTCSLKFHFQSLVLDLARPVIELMARNKMRQDFEALAQLICNELEQAP